MFLKYIFSIFVFKLLLVIIQQNQVTLKKTFLHVLLLIFPLNGAPKEIISYYSYIKYTIKLI